MGPLPTMSGVTTLFIEVITPQQKLVGAHFVTVEIAGVIVLEVFCFLAVSGPQQVSTSQSCDSHGPLISVGLDITSD